LNPKSKTQSLAHPFVGTLVFHPRFDSYFLEILCTWS